MHDYSINIAGSEWIIIIFIALVLILGTNQLPGAARKLGKAVNEYNKAKNDIQNQMKDVTQDSIRVSGPVENERQKLESIAKSLGINTSEKSDDELRNVIAGKIGQKNAQDDEKNKLP